MDSYTFKDMARAQRFVEYMQTTYDNYPSMTPKKDGTVVVEWSTGYLSGRDRIIRDVATGINL